MTDEFERVIIRPYDNPPEGLKPKPDRFDMQLKIALRLASIKAYNEEGEIIGEDGDYIKNSRVAALIRFCLTPGKSQINNLHPFISLMRRANIPVDWLANEHAKNTLSATNHKPINEPIKEEAQYETQVPPVREKGKSARKTFTARKPIKWMRF